MTLLGQSLSKHAYRSFDKIAFLPDSNVSEHLILYHLVMSTLVVNKNKKVIKNKIAHFSLTPCNHRDQPWQVRYQVKAHDPGNVYVIKNT